MGASAGTRTVWAVVLAGRKDDGRLAAGGKPTGWEALIDVAGRPMVARVLDALGGATAVTGGAVVGPPAVEDLMPPDFVRVEPVGDTVANLVAGLAARPPGTEHVLIATADIPLITAPIVDGLLKSLGDLSEDVYFPVVRREVAEARFPHVRRTYVHLRDGRYTAGNLFVVRPRVLLADRGGEGLLDRMVRWRKAPWRMALVLGPGLLAGLLLHTLSLEDAARRVSRRLGLSGRAIVTPHAEIGVDIDKPGDLALCREVLRGVGDA